MNGARTSRRYPVPGRLALCFLLLVIGSGCSTTHRLSSTSAGVVSSRIVAGDKVIITKTNGSTVRMKVDDVTSTGLDGDGKFVAYRDMLEISVKRVDSEKTTKNVLTVVVIVGAAAWALNELAKGLAATSAQSR